MDELDALKADFIALSLAPFQDFITIRRDKVGTFTVSTIYAGDIKEYETAIIDKNGSHPVERYKSEQIAIVGHAKWVVDLPKLTKITKIGYGFTIEPEVIVLQR